MSVRSWSLNDDILKTDVFSCHKCKNILKSRIMSSTTGINFCEECFTTQETAKNNFFRNFALETVVQHFYVVCQFFENGCSNNRIKYEDLNNHEQICNLKMALQSWSLNDEIVELHVLKCHVCQTILKSPIMSSSNGINVCGECLPSQDTTKTTFVRNFALEGVLKHLYVDCRYYENGCYKSRIKYEDLQTHEKMCMFRNFSCPLSNILNCLWKGSIDSMNEHVETNHKNILINGSVYNFDINCVPAPFHDFIKWFVFDNNYFLFYAKLDKNNCEFNFNMVKIVNSADQNLKYTCKVKQKNCSWGKNYFNHQNFPVADIYNNDCFTKTKTLDLNVLKKISSSDTLSITIELIQDNIPKASIENKIIKNLECPVCKTVMKSKIMQCINGHSICKFCVENLKECPLCRCEISKTTRNFLLEALTEGMCFPCKFQDFGCKVYLLKEKLSDHEKGCYYKQYKCLFASKCRFDGTLASLVEHLDVEHNDRIFYSNTFSVQINCLDLSDTFCVIALDSIFKVVCFFVESTGELNVQVNVVDESDNNKYGLDYGLIYKCLFNASSSKYDVDSKIVYVCINPRNN